MGSRNDAQVCLWRHRANKLCGEIDPPPRPLRALGVGVDSCGLCLEGNGWVAVTGVFVFVVYGVEAFLHRASLMAGFSSMFAFVYRHCKM